VIDVVRGWEAPFNPARVVREVFDVLHGYRVLRVCGDRYAGEWPVAEFRRYGVRYETASKPKSDLYLDLLAALNSDLVALPDDSELVRQLCALQRHVRQGGREKVDHPYAAHDDRANAVAGVSHLLLARKRSVVEWGNFGGPIWRSDGTIAGQNGEVITEWEPETQVQAEMWLDHVFRGR
jgi:hypothetical protein